MTSNAFSDVIAVVPAAGIGSRMQAACPKQYLTLHGRTIIEHSIYRLLAHPSLNKVILALSPQDRWFSRLSLAKDSRLVTVDGGLSRSESVLAALQVAGSAKWVLVHDAARPCLHPVDLNRLLAIMSDSRTGGILAAPVHDTIKRSNQDKKRIIQTVDREQLWHALTPQLFPLPLLRRCLTQALAENAVVTDEASALEYCGYRPRLVIGRSDNIKITRPEDLALAEFYLARLHAEENA